MVMVKLSDSTRTALAWCSSRELTRTFWGFQPTVRFTLYAILISSFNISLFSGKALADWPSQRGNPEATGVALGPVGKNLKEIWKYKLADAVESTPAIAGGKVFLGDFTGKFVCLDLKTGKLLWETEIAAARAAPAVSQGKVIVGDLDGLVHALNVEDGKEIWQVDIEGEIDSGATIVEQKVLIASQAGELVCLNLADGKKIWSYETSDQIRCSPTVASGRVFLGGCDGQLHQVSLETGESAGKPLSLDGPTGSTPTVIDQLAIVPTFGGVVLGLNWKAEQRTWEYTDTDRDQEYRCSAAATGEIAVVTSQGKQVTAIDLKTGKEIWKKAIRKRSDASPVIAGDSVFIAAADGRLYRFDLKSGEITWEYEVRGSFLASPAISEGKLIVATDKGDVICFE